jgi:tripartite ATP-independent transporter DctM subunit
MSPEILILLMFVTLMIGIFAGGHLAFVLGGIAVVFGYFGWGPQAFPLFVQRMHTVTLNYVLCAVPLFVFMGFVLEKARIAEDIFEALSLYFRRVRGGLAIATTGVCAILGMCTGVVAASIIAAGVIALPPMLKRGYDKKLVLGTVAAGGTLGILIPPSIMLIFYAAESGISAGKLFAAAFTPGLLLATLYAVYIYVVAIMRPDRVPAPENIDEKIPLKTYLASLKGILPVGTLILAVLGAILFGIATPTEAAGTGAFASLLIAAFYKRLTWKMVWECSIKSVETIGMLGFILITANCFSTVFLGMGGQEIVTDLLMGSGLPSSVILLIILSVIFVLGMFIDWIGILYICLPTFIAVGELMGWDQLWMALIVCICLQTAWLTPPFGYALFFLRGIAPKDITFGDIIQGCLPFIVLQLIGVGLCILFPQIITWLPNLIYG